MTMPASPDNSSLLSGLDSQLSSLMSAVGASNQQEFQQAVAEFNANYGNQQAQTYGYNLGTTESGISYPGVGAPTSATTQQLGSVGYVPGMTGAEAGPSTTEESNLYNDANQAASQTGLYAAPQGSTYTPGTVVTANGGQQYGQLYYYVAANGQFQPITPDQAKAMAPGGNINNLTNVPLDTAIQLQNAPPTQVPQQTLNSLSTYGNLNSQAQNLALQQSQVTGMYQQPNQILPPGTDMGGGQFQNLPFQVQQQYYLANGSNWNSAMAAWVQDANKAITQAGQAAGGNALGAGQSNNPQETQQAQQQYFNQANQLAQTFGQYYSPTAPGQTGQAGVNTPNPGQLTEAAQQFNTTTAADLAKTAAGLSGPSNYFQYLNAINGGNSILSNLSTGQAMPQGGAPVGSTQPMTLASILGNLGLNGTPNRAAASGISSNGSTGQGMMGYDATQSGGASNLNSIVNSIGSSAVNGGYAPGSGSTTSNGQVNLPYGVGQLPQMNQIQPSAWNSMSPDAQAFVSSAYAAAGYDPSNIAGNIAAETGGTSAATDPGSASTSYANTGAQGLYS